jgi:hypothetical protein
MVFPVQEVAVGHIPGHGPAQCFAMKIRNTGFNNKYCIICP